MSPKTDNIIRIAAGTVAMFLMLWTVLYALLQVVYPTRYYEFVDKYSNEFDIDSMLVYSVMKNESGFTENAKSRKNAVGLMQITPDTADWIASKLNIDLYSLSDPETNIKFSCWYLNYLSNRFKNTETVVAAYNAGEGRVKKWLSDPDCSDDGIKLRYIPYGETDRYVKSVIDTYNIYCRLY